MTRRYWLVKTEPNVYSLAQLQREVDQIGHWDGVRNYQARNLLRDEMKLGDGVLFYHSRVPPLAVVATARVVREGYPDPTQFDPTSPYHDAKSKPDKPRWFMVDIQLDKTFARPVTLEAMRQVEGLEGMVLLRRGSRLSVQPVSALQWNIVLQLGGVAKTGSGLT